MLSKRFKASRCKLSLQLAISRIQVLENLKAARLKQMKRELAALLKEGNEQIAMIRVRQLFMEEKMMAAYDIIGLYCDFIVTRMPIIESQKNCPADLKEAIASVIYASLRCSDILELQDVHKHFRAKYGKEFIAANLELKSECAVNHVVVEKLCIKVPDDETKIKILKRIAADHNVKWDYSDTGEQNDAGQNHISATNYSENDTTRSSSGSRTNLYGDIVIPTPPASITSHFGTMVAENEAGRKNLRNPLYGNASPIDRQMRSMQFMDAASAAEAAAESAELARMAAMAAAEFSSREAITRQFSDGSRALPVYDTNDEVPGRSVGSMQKGTDIEVWRKMDENQKKGQIIRDHLLGTAARRYSHYGSVEDKTSRSSSHSSLTSIDDDTPISYLQKTRGFHGIASGSSLSSMSSFDDVIPDAYSPKPNEYGCLQKGFSAGESLDQAQMSMRTDSGEAGERRTQKHSPFTNQDATGCETPIVENLHTNTVQGHGSEVGMQPISNFQKGSSRNARSNVFSDYSESEKERVKNNWDEKPNVAGESCEISTSGFSNRNHPSPSYLKSPTKLNNVGRRLVSFMVEEPQFSRFSLKEFDAMDNSDELPLSSGPEKSDCSGDDYGNLQPPLDTDSGARSRISQTNSANAKSNPRPLARTPDSESKEKSKFSKFNVSDEQNFQRSQPHVKNSAQSGSSKPAAVSSEGKQSPRIAASNGNPMPGTLESSLNRPNHVHPKLPEYDALKALMDTLRTNPHP